MTRKNKQGFTLLEILVALFIFSILALIMANGFKSVMNIQFGIEKQAARFHQLQLALLLMSQDIEQTVDRPIIDAFGKNEVSFIGQANGFTLTHLGLANPMGNINRSAMRRVRYFLNGSVLLRAVWPVLDQAPATLPSTRVLMNNITSASFQYLAANGRFYSAWPVPERRGEVLPRAVRVFISLPNWGRMSQLYVISAESNQALSPSST